MRHLYTKSHGKSSKASKTICLGETAVYNEIEGSTVKITGSWDEDWLVGCYDNPVAPTGAETQACLDDQDDYSLPFSFDRDGNVGPSFQFVPGGSPASINDSAFCGSVPEPDPTPTMSDAGKVGGSSVTLEYQSLDLTDISVGDVQFIEYDYKCDDTNATIGGICTSAPSNMRLNIYTRKSATSSTASWYDCRLDFSPSMPAANTEWGTFYINSTDVPYNIKSNGENCTSDISADNTLAELGTAGYVLGTGFQLIVFNWNVGTTSDTDNGLEGCYDSIRIKLFSEPNVRFYDL